MEVGNSLIKDFLDKVGDLFIFNSQTVEELNPSDDKGTLKEYDRNSNIMDSYEEDMTIIVPQSFEEAKDVTDRLKRGYIVVINLNDVDYQLSSRIIDFVSGANYALGGNSEKVGENIFLFTPSSIQINYNHQNNKDDYSLIRDNLSVEERRRLQGE